MIHFGAAVLLGLAVASTPVVAHSTPAAAGMLVKDTAGRDVGTVTVTDGTAMTVRTDRHEVKILAASTIAHDGSLLIAMSCSELNAPAHAIASSRSITGRERPADGAGAVRPSGPLDEASFRQGQQATHLTSSDSSKRARDRVTQ